tara:strand:- start:2554 stop:2970 length:417 start_codon:yes stop_codon:yes gene_type:complete
LKIEEVHIWEKALVTLLNFDKWELEWCGGGYEHFDAKGKTPKGFDCVVEMKFRNKYYEDKMLEKYKYDKLFEMDESVVKLYFISDPKGSYMFWLNKLKMPDPKDMWCPDTTLWTKKKILKPCYLIPENLAVTIDYHIK